MATRYCIHCGSDKVKEVTDGNLAIFFCSDCQKKSGQATQADGKMIVMKFEERIKHVSVGALIERGGKILLAKRRTFPYRFSNVAGHLEYGETPEEGMRREVSEEVGLDVKKAELVFHGDIVGSRCRAGADTHEWYFYKVECEGEPIKNEEFEFVKWYSLDELEDIDLGFTTRYLFEKIGILGKEK